MFFTKKKLVEFTLEKKKKLKSSSISLLKNGEIFPEKIFAQHLLYVSVEYQVIY
jgi:hypothetical protein